MSLELLYTSSTVGLRQGSRGFCTVLSTSGMPVNLASRLETLSGYRHVFSPQDAGADDNPVCYSHLRVKVGGNTSNVLSRISSYGVDYSGRTNKLAHHVVVEPYEQPPAGPAWVLSQGGVLRDEWDGNNQTPPVGPKIPMQNQPQAICQTWATTMGDAGWGGQVAEALRSASARPLWIIFDLSQNVSLLSLLNESIALLPEAERWLATFSTYYTNLPPEIDCRARCVLAGTEEARLASARGHVIDLTQPQTLSSESPLIQLARTGSEPLAAATSISTPAAPPVPLISNAVDSGKPPHASDRAYQLQPPPTRRISTPPSSQPPTSPSGPPPRPKAQKSRAAALLTIATVVAFLLILVAAAIPLINKSNVGKNQSASATDDNTEMTSQTDNSSEHYALRQAAELPLAEMEKAIELLNFTSKMIEPAFDSTIPDAPIELQNIEKAIKNLTFDFKQPAVSITNSREVLGELNSPEVKVIFDKNARKRLEEFLGTEDSADPKTVRGRRTLLKKQAKDLQGYYEKLQKKKHQFNEQVQEYINKLADFKTNHEKFLESAPDELKRVNALEKLAQSASVSIVDFPANDDLETQREQIKSLDEQVKKVLTAISQLEKIRTVLAEQNANKNHDSNDVTDPKVVYLRVNTDSQIPTNISGTTKFPISLKISEIQSYRWEEDAKDKTAPVTFAKSKDKYIAALSYPNQNFLKLKIQSDVSESNPEIVIEFRPKKTTEKSPRYTTSSTESFDSNCIELIEAIDEVNSLRNPINNWVRESTIPESEIEAETDQDQKKSLQARNTEINEINDLTGKVQALIEHDWKSLSNQMLEKLETHRHKIKSIKNSPKNSKYITSLSLRLEHLNQFISKQTMINQLASVLSKPTQVPQETLRLKTRGKSANPLSVPADSAIEFSITLQLLLEPEPK